MHPVPWLMAAAAVLGSTPAEADHGYFQIGYGAEARGVGGAAAAATRDAFGAAANPATTVWVGNRFDANLSMTSGSTRFRRQAGLPPPVNGALDTDLESEKRWDPLAEVAYSRMVAPDLALSVVGYGNGAGTFLPADTTVCLAPPPAPPGTTFRGNALCGSGRIVSGLKQLIVAPTLSMRLSDSVSVGGSLLLAAQEFKAEGQQALTSQSASPDRVTNGGTAYSFGAGLRVGGYWRAHEMLSLGASWSPRVAMSRFKEYEGLLANRGRLDIPETLMAGLQFSPTSALSLLLDYQRIRYSGTDALANPGFDGSALRGSNGGPGAGWRDVDVYKLGVRYQATPALRVSAGMSANSRVYEDKDTTHNVTSPSTFRRHYTLGAGYTNAAGSEWSFFYAHSPKRTTTGTSGQASAVVSQLTGVPTAAGQESLSTSLHVVGIQYSIRR